jgi:hypothetical protein
LPEEDVYKLLIDAFGLRQEDNFKFEGLVDSNSKYDGGSHSTNAFQNFLRLAESRSGLLPSWWDAQKRAACVQFGSIVRLVAFVVQYSREGGYYRPLWYSDNAHAVRNDG